MTIELGEPDSMTVRTFLRTCEALSNSAGTISNRNRSIMTRCNQIMNSVYKISVPSHRESYEGLWICELPRHVLQVD